MKLGVIGFGNMGSAIVRGALDKKVIDKKDVYVFDKKEAVNKRVQEEGMIALDSEAAVAKAADVVLLAVKPQQMEATAQKIGKSIEGKAMMSILPGVTEDRFHKAFGTENFRILRLLPNTPALVFEGAFAISKENNFEAEELEFAKNLFEAIGFVVWVKSYDLDASCGLSGGGPAWVAMFVEALADGGVKEGLTRDVAYELAIQTVLGSAKLLKEKGMHPGQLKDMVTSPAGTTIAGCEVLEENGFRAATMKAVVAATKRSREL